MDLNLSCRELTPAGTGRKSGVGVRRQDARGAGSRAGYVDVLERPVRAQELQSVSRADHDTGRHGRDYFLRRGMSVSCALMSSNSLAVGR